MASISALLQTAQGHLNSRRFAEAEQVCQQILRTDRRQAEAMHILALSFYYRGDAEQAIQWLRKAILMQDNRAQFFSNLATICAAAGHRDDATRYHRRAVEIEPRNADYLSNAGLACLNTGQHAAAVDFCRRALAIQPNHMAASNNLGLALKAAGDLDGAITELQKVVRLRPDFLSAWSNLASAYSQRGDIESAINAAQKALSLNPNEEATNHPLLMILSYAPSLSPQQIADEHKRWAARRADPLETILAPPPSRSSGDKIRLGYVSPDFRRHAVTQFFEPILANHDRNRFTIFCYSASPIVDAVTDRLRGLGDNWGDVTPLNDLQLAELIRRDQIDILVDLSGHTEHSRLLAFAYRPAPIQVSYLGYSATTGMRQVDYFFTDSILDKPGDERLYSEKLLYLPSTFACYLPSSDAPDVNVRSSEVPVTFISQHALIRLNDAVIEQWANILKRVPGGRLIIARDKLTATAQQRLRERFGAYGVDASRLDFRQIDMACGNLQHYGDADIALDTFPWSGHTTGCEGLWMGCPMVTWCGASHAGRRVASVLTQLGLTDLIAYSPEEYVEIAVDLANDTGRRAELRGKLREIMGRSPLMDGVALTRDIESAYERILVK